MIYITDEDLLTESYERFINESTVDFPEMKNVAELKAIGIVNTLIKGRYDVALIFDEDEPLRDEYLADIVAKITIWKILGRNAARKLGTHIKEDFEWAIKQLEKINAGKLTLSLPAAPSNSSAPTSDTIWGNNKNENFYI